MWCQCSWTWLLHFLLVPTGSVLGCSFTPLSPGKVFFYFSMQRFSCCEFIVTSIIQLDSFTWIQSTDTQHSFCPQFNAPSSTMEIGKLLKLTKFTYFPTGKFLGAKPVLPMRCIHLTGNLIGNLKAVYVVEASSCCFWGCFWCCKGFWNAVLPSTRKWFSVQSCGRWGRQGLLGTRYLILNLIYIGFLPPFLSSSLYPSLLPSFPFLLLHFLLRTPLKIVDRIAFSCTQ